jgi:hypothetical protein
MIIMNKIKNIEKHWNNNMMINLISHKINKKMDIIIFYRLIILKLLNIDKIIQCFLNLVLIIVLIKKIKLKMIGNILIH